MRITDDVTKQKLEMRLLQAARKEKTLIGLPCPWCERPLVDPGTFTVDGRTVEWSGASCWWCETRWNYSGYSADMMHSDVNRSPERRLGDAIREAQRIWNECTHIVKHDRAWASLLTQAERVEQEFNERLVAEHGETK